MQRQYEGLSGVGVNQNGVAGRYRRSGLRPTRLPEMSLAGEMRGEEMMLGGRVEGNTPNPRKEVTPCKT